jgi:hypothetical protein
VTPVTSMSPREEGDDGGFPTSCALPPSLPPSLAPRPPCHWRGARQRRLPAR